MKTSFTMRGATGGHDPTSPNTAPVTQKDSLTYSSLHIKPHLQMRGATGVAVQPHQILRLSRRKTRILSPHHIWNLILQCAEQQVSRSNLTKYCALSRRKTHLLNHHHIWNLILQCAEQQVSRSNLTKYCACHAKLHCENFWQNLWKQVKRHFQCGDDPSMIREWSENEYANRNPPRKWGYFSRSPEAFSIVKYNVLAPNLTFKPFTKCCACHKKIHLTFTKYCAYHKKLHLNFTKYCTCHESDTWTSPNTAPTTKSNTGTSPSTAPNHEK